MEPAGDVVGGQSGQHQRGDVTFPCGQSDRAHKQRHDLGTVCGLDADRNMTSRFREGSGMYREPVPAGRGWRPGAGREVGEGELGFG